MNIDNKYLVFLESIRELVYLLTGYTELHSYEEDQFYGLCRSKVKNDKQNPPLSSFYKGGRCIGLKRDN